MRVGKERSTIVCVNAWTGDDPDSTIDIRCGSCGKVLETIQDEDEAVHVWDIMMNHKCEF
jgi:hypothetical protein